jgi:RHS repeat-associated protein
MRAVVDEAGDVVEAYDYYPFGLQSRSYKEKGDPLTKETFTGKEQDGESNLHYFGARFYDAGAGRFLSTDAFSEKTLHLSPYHYVMNSPMIAIDINGDTTFVTQNEDGTYTVDGVNLSGEEDDTGIFVRNADGSITFLGNSLTSHSFVGDDGEAVNGAIIDMGSSEGQNFLNGVIANNPNIRQYINNWQKYDFKENGVENRGNLSRQQYHHRGSRLSNGTIVSARDAGNMAAGLVSGRNHQNWFETRIAFDSFQMLRSGELGVEGPTSVKAQKIGHDMGKQMRVPENEARPTFPGKW